MKLPFVRSGLLRSLMSSALCLGLHAAHIYTQTSTPSTARAGEARLDRGGTHPIRVSDLLRIREITAIDVARDGSKAVYAVRGTGQAPPDSPPPAASAISLPSTTAPSPAPAALPSANAPLERWTYRSHLYVVDLAREPAAPLQITFGESFDAVPKFSPDGQWIAFIRTAARGSVRVDASSTTAQQAQVWIMRTQGGEPWPLTDFAGGCDEVHWSPGGRTLVVGANVKFHDLPGQPVWPSERPRRGWSSAAQTPGDVDGDVDEVRSWLAQNEWQANPVVIDRLDFQDEMSIRRDMLFHHFFAIEFDETAAGAAPRKREQTRHLAPDFYDCREPAFTPDGTSILYVAKKPRDQHPDRVVATEIWQINVDGTNDRKILGMEGWSLFSPRSSPDGKVFAFRGQQIDNPLFRQTLLGMAPLEGAANVEPFWLTNEETFTGSVNLVHWLPTQPSLVFTTARRGGFPLMTINPGLLEPAPLLDHADDQPVGVHALAVGGGAIVYSSTTVAVPNALMLRTVRGVRVLHDVNPWAQEHAVVAPVRGEITRPDGTQIEYWLMEPANRQPGRKYPLCLQIHGGPADMWGPGEFTMWHEFQMLCSRGYGVLYANPRGSSGYGYDFQRANFQNWGEAPAGDVLAAVDHALLNDWVDAQRLVIAGGSYGGYLTAWIIAHDHRFRAAVADRGVYDLATFFGESNVWRLLQWAFGGYPYDSRVRDTIVRNSPITHVSRMRTPLLILHASSDLRVGVSQSEMLYRSLKTLNKPVEYVRYPGSGHDMRRTGDVRQRMDRLNRMTEFFERFIGDPRRPLVRTISD